MTDEEADNEHMGKILEGVMGLGWDIGVPSIDEDDDVPGLIIGKPEYLKWMADNLPANKKVLEDEAAAFRTTLIVLSVLPEVWRVVNERHPGLLKGEPPRGRSDRVFFDDATFGEGDDNGME